MSIISSKREDEAFNYNVKIIVIKTSPANEIIWLRGIKLNGSEVQTARKYF
jgi:hypothetical protein